MCNVHKLKVVIKYADSPCSVVWYDTNVIKYWDTEVVYVRRKEVVVFHVLSFAVFYIVI